MPARAAKRPLGTLRLSSPKATLALGERLGALLEPGDFVALSGPLGAGKTLLVRGAAKGAGVPEDERTSSPTFALVHTYRGGRVPLQHMDLYRLSGARELFALGFDNLLAEPVATLCEWPERAGEALPPERLELRLTLLGPASRSVELVAYGARAGRLRDALAPLSR